MPSVTLYTRAGCGLCDEMKTALEKRGYEVREVDVDADPDLEREYGLDVPVAILDGKLLAKHRLR